MKKLALVIPALLLFLALAPCNSAWAENYPPGYAYQVDLLSPEEMDDLLAPIALYPDPLIAQILPAATFVDQIDEAARYVRQFGGAARIDAQPWDLSVKAVAHYPDVLFMMDQKYDWTVSLGQAFIDQPQDVMDAIQRLRADARGAGNLFSTREQLVIVDPYGVRIVPAAPEYVYVPVYDPQVVYVERYDPYYPFITFGTGFTIGAWLNRDFDWREHRVYYHGWRGGGWISRSRPHIRDRGNVYINRRAATITVNNRVLQHDTHRFRQELRNETVRRREQGGSPNRPSANQPPPGRIDRQRAPEPGRPRAPETRGQLPPASVRQQAPAAVRQAPAAIVQQPAPVAGQQAAPTAGQRRHPADLQQRPPAPSAVQQTAPAALQQPKPATGTRPAAQPTVGDVFRGRDVQRAQPASRSGYGGYGSGKDATIYRQRGQSSQENMRQPTRPSPVQRPSPATAPSIAPRAVAPTSGPVAAPAPPRPAAAPAGVPAAPRAATPRPAAPERERGH